MCPSYVNRICLFTSSTGWVGCILYFATFRCQPGYERVQPVGFISLSCNWVTLHNEIDQIIDRYLKNSNFPPTSTASSVSTRTLINIDPFTKNLANGRHRISQPMRIVELIFFFPLGKLYNSNLEKVSIVKLF